MSGPMSLASCGMGLLLAGAAWAVCTSRACVETDGQTCLGPALGAERRRIYNTQLSYRWSAWLGNWDFILSSKSPLDMVQVSLNSEAEHRNNFSWKRRVCCEEEFF